MQSMISDRSSSGAIKQAVTEEFLAAEKFRALLDLAYIRIADVQSEREGAVLSASLRSVVGTRIPHILW